jgi:hypothetical protein
MCSVCDNIFFVEVGIIYFWNHCLYLIWKTCI